VSGEGSTPRRPTRSPIDIAMSTWATTSANLQASKAEADTRSPAPRPKSRAARSPSKRCRPGQENRAKSSRPGASPSVAGPSARGTWGS
jgi:hypothetical protein